MIITFEPQLQKIAGGMDAPRLNENFEALKRMKGLVSEQLPTLKSAL